MLGATAHPLLGSLCGKLLALTAKGNVMQAEVELLEARALKLSVEDRARLLDRLILSLDEDKVRDKAWDELAALRDTEIESGQVVEVDGPEAVAKLRAKYG